MTKLAPLRSVAAARFLAAAIAFAVPFLFSSHAHASADAHGLDYSVAMGARSMPTGATVYGDVGYGYLVWGENGPGQYGYGYIRPSARVYTSAVVNRAEAALELYPVSVIGLKIGGGQSSRQSNSATQDCTLVTCRGTLRRFFIESHLAMAYNGWFVQSTSGLELQTPGIKNQFYADESSALAGNPGGDNLLKSEVAVGKLLDSGMALGVMVSTARMLNAGSSNNQQSVFVGSKFRDLTWFAGFGVYESNTQNHAPTFFGLLRWTGLPGIGI